MVNKKDKTMKNNTPMKITIELSNVDHTMELSKFLTNLMYRSIQGGDLNLTMNDDPPSYIGHDVVINEIEVNLAEKNKKEEVT
jgi:hypothetical protein